MSNTDSDSDKEPEVEKEEDKEDGEDIDEDITSNPNPLVPAWTLDEKDVKAQRAIEQIPHDEPGGVTFKTEKQKREPTLGKKSFSVDGESQQGRTNPLQQSGLQKRLQGRGYFNRR